MTMGGEGHLRAAGAEVGHAGLVHRGGEDDVAILGPADCVRVVEAEGLCCRLLVLYGPFGVRRASLQAARSGTETAAAKVPVGACKRTAQVLRLQQSRFLLKPTSSKFRLNVQQQPKSLLQPAFKRIGLWTILNSMDQARARLLNLSGMNLWL